MASDRTTLRPSATIERRPPVATRVQRSAAENPQSPAQTLQARLGNRATQMLISRSIAHGKESTAAQVNITTPTSVQLSKQTRLPAKISKPTDPAELEAEETARKVMRMQQPPATKPVAPKGPATPAVQRAAAPTQPTSAPRSTPRVSISGGSPLPSSVRTHMEPRFGANFSNVRVHTDASAAQQSAHLGANAFTVGEHIFFGKDKFQPQSASGKELIAHELTHTVQQEAVVQRQIETTVTQRSEPTIQRFGIGDALDWIADKANYLPGFRLLTIVLGVNPINMSPVDRSAANILRALLEMIPVVGALIAEALNNYGILAKVGAWVEGQIKTLGLVGGSLKAALMEFLDSLSWSDIFHLDDVYERGKRIFTAPIDRLINFGKALVSDILTFIRDAILLPLAKLAEGTRGYDLLKAVLGKDPITGQPVTPTPEMLIGGFMKLIGQEEVWENAKKANAIPRLWAWFQGAIQGLMGFVTQIPAVFIGALQSLEIIDLVLPPKAFLKIASVFGGFVMQFITWAGKTVWTLLEIIFDVVSPGALVYIKKTGAALKSILKDPIPFVKNLVKAAKLGFDNFADHFLDHLQAGLIDWLVGALPGIYIPKALSLIEIAKFVFSVLGLTWANIRQKLVKAIGETAVKVLETGFDVVLTLVTEGPAAAWDKIKEQLANLKDMVIGGIIDMVVDAVVKKAIPKLISMFIPGAGFISAILSIYDTVMVFVNKIKQIAAVVKSFVDSIVAIAQGEIAGAAARVESALAGVLSLAINFLAGFAGLGKVADKVMEIINKVRAPIDKALDWLVNWIVTAAKSLGKLVVQAGVPTDPNERFKQGMDLAEKAVNRFAGKRVGKLVLTPLLTGIKARYGFQKLDVFQEGNNWWIEGVLNPAGKKKTNVQVADTGAAPGTKETKMPAMTVEFSVKKSIHEAKDSAGVSLWTHYEQQLMLQQNKLRSMMIQTWLTNITEFYGDKGKGIAAKGRSKEGDKIAKQIRERLVANKAADLMAKDKSLTLDAAKAKARDFYSEQAVLHLLDQGAGGAGTEFLGDLLQAADQEVLAKDEGYVGNARVDYSIGASWPSRAKELKQNIETRVDPSVFATEKMNVTLKATKS